MEPTILPLCQEYGPERADYFHRHKKKAYELYKTWEVSGSDLSFTAWTQSDDTPPPPASECVVYYEGENDLKTIRVHIDEEGRAAHRFEPLPIFDIPAQMSPLDTKRNTAKYGLSTYALAIPVGSSNLYAAMMNTKGEPGNGPRVQHSSLAAGGDVHFAAEAKFNDGLLKSVTDESGHYKPDLYAFVWGLRFMKELGLDLSHASVHVTRNTAGGRDSERVRYNSATDFLSLYAQDGFTSPAYSGQVNDINDAFVMFEEKDFGEQDEEEQHAIYYDRSNNELVELRRDSEGIVISETFTKKYDRMHSPNKRARPFPVF